MTSSKPQSDTLAQLAERLEQLEQPVASAPRRFISSGHLGLDRFLPEGGFESGTIVEWLSASRASGAGTLALLAAREAARAGGALVVVEHQKRFYPPAALALGIEPAQLIVVRPESRADYAWTVDQVLRSRGVAALWCWPREEDDHTLRRWQLAAEASGALGLFVRGAQARRLPCWAQLRLLVNPLPAATRERKRVQHDQTRHDRTRQVRVELVRNRSGRSGRAIELEIPPLVAPPLVAPSLVEDSSHETRSVHLASAVAPATTGRRSRRA